MIPKKIHYCWFGKKEKTKMAKKCIKSWKKYCPDYEIIEWNENNFDIEQYPYAKYCLQQGKYAFLSDFVRLVVIQKYGGIYFDTDVEVIKNFDRFLQYQAFYGFESKDYINTGHGFGAEVNHLTVKMMLEQYLSLQPNKNDSYELAACPKLNTEALLPLGLKLDGKRQAVAGAEIFPSEYFNPYDDPTGVLRKTKNTFSIHWYSKSWISKRKILKSKLTKPFHRLFGVECFDLLKKKK